MYFNQFNHCNFPHQYIYLYCNIRYVILSDAFFFFFLLSLLLLLLLLIIIILLLLLLLMMEVSSATFFGLLPLISFHLNILILISPR